MDLFYLRDGDFLPEPIESFCEAWHCGRERAIEFLANEANLFPSKDEAMEASTELKATLVAHQARRGRLAGIRIDVGRLQSGEN
ncbi:MAG: hypothetical protein K2K68_02505 [Duncaniella sp.]|nr:hypothetical protein [Duncaniella sp.]